MIITDVERQNILAQKHALRGSERPYKAFLTQRRVIIGLVIAVDVFDMLKYNAKQGKARWNMLPTIGA